jgi:P pilus assembly chaperone PapD
MRKLFSIVVLGILANHAFAGIYLDRIIVQFAAEDRGRQDIVVFNESSEENAFVDVTVLEIINPGGKDEKQIPVTDPKSSKFLVTPAKIVIPPGGKKQVRLVDLKPNAFERERIFRVTFTPVLPPLSEEASVIRVVVSYQTLVLIPPGKLTEDLKSSRDGKRLTLENLGNSFVLLEGGRQCIQPEQCVDVQGKRLYAGNTLEIELPHDAPVSFQATSHGGVKNLTIN